MASIFDIPNISENSQTLVDLFLDSYGPKSSKKTYANAIRRLQEETGLRDLDNITSEQYEVTIKKLSNANSKLITSFVQFLFCNDLLKKIDGYERYYWNSADLKKHFENMKKRKESSKLKNKFKSELSFKEIEKLMLFERNILETQDYEDIRLAFCFHALFFDGINADNLKEMDLKDMANGTITTKDGEYDIPEEYWDMVHYYDTKRENNTKLFSLNNYINILGRKIGISDLKPIKIIKARKQNLFQCPECGEQYLAFSDNWISINGKMVCIDCAQQYSISDEKKNSDVIEPISSIEVKIITNEEKQAVEMFSSSYEQLCETLKVPRNFDEWTEHIKLIGIIGERFVLEKEKKALKDIGRYDLAELVDGSIALDNTNGFDILSYCAVKKGEIPKFIEVKSTEGKLETPFYISEREKNTAENKWKNGEIYEIHRVYNIGKEDVGIQIFTDFEQISFQNVLFKATIEVPS